MLARRDYDRYYLLKKEGDDMEPMPFVKIPESQSDKYERWNAGSSRLDLLSNKYYGSPFYDFFILLANPNYLNEWEIPDDEVIRIPFPIQKVKIEYENILKSKIDY
jgi:hypothetical protein